MDAGLIAIHQPNFFPWLGYFDKIARADRFVLLDDVQFPRQSRGTYVNRVKVLIDGDPRWLTAPVSRVKGTQRIGEVATSDSEPWREKLVRTLRHAYGRAASFDEVFPRMEELISNPDTGIARYNETAIRALMSDLGLSESKLVRSSELGVDGKATELLIAIVREVGGSAYLSGGGAGGYQEDEKFREAGIDLVFQEFDPPSYPQLAPEPVTGLSIIDALFNCGVDGTQELLGG